MSLSTKASLNFSAIDNSVELEDDGGMMGLIAIPCFVHVPGSISLTTPSSRVIFGNASQGTWVPLNPKGDLGSTTIRGHSVEKSSNEFLSMFGCKMKTLQDYMNTDHFFEQMSLKKRY